jgi:nucleoside-diphosphate-sugar epimerase
MRVCITGGTGFIGGPLVRRLLAEGASVRVLARQSPHADALRASGVQVVPGHLGDAQAIQQAVSGVDVVFHIAAKVNPPGTKAEYFDTNAGGTERVLKASLEAGASKVVYLSSISVYGLVEPGQVIDENTGYDPQPEYRDYYAQSKIAADALALRFAAQTNLRVVVLRPGLIYGPGRPLPLGLLGFRAGATDVVFGSPEFGLPLNYTENLLDAMQLAARLPGTSAQQFNVIDDDDLTLGAYRDTVEQLSKRQTVYFPSWPLRAGLPVAQALWRALPLERSSGAALQQVRRAMQDRHYVTQRIREATGWAPRTSLREAMQRTIEACRDS